MKAFVSKIVNGRPVLGTENQWVTNHYKTQDNLVKFAVKPFLKTGEAAIVELFYNWDNRYGAASKTFVIRKFDRFIVTESRGW